MNQQYFPPFNSYNPNNSAYNVKPLDQPPNTTGQSPYNTQPQQTGNPMQGNPMQAITGNMINGLVNKYLPKFQQINPVDLFYQTAQECGISSEQAKKLFETYNSKIQGLIK